MPKTLPDVVRLRSALDYNPVTGVFKWKRRADRSDQWNGRYAGTIAGKLSDLGYRVIWFDGISYRAHRLAWLYVFGGPPLAEIDHINCYRDDNSIANLREATRVSNMRNSKKWKNKNLPKGVSASDNGNRFKARIMVSGVIVRLGYFPTANEAHTAYMDAAKQYFGEFANPG